jgi:hypothetical protein
MTTSPLSTTSAMTPRDRLNSLIESAATSVQPILENLSDGSVRVCLGTTCGTVSSHHLVEPKINQLKASSQNNGSQL